MDVHIDETWEKKSAVEVYDRSAVPNRLGINLISRRNCADPIVFDPHRVVVKHRYIRRVGNHIAVHQNQTQVTSHSDSLPTQLHLVAPRGVYSIGT